MAKPTQELMRCSPELAKTIIKETINAGENSVPPFLHGPPGVGKSSVVAEACVELGVQFIDLRLVQLDPVDLRGLPYTHPDENGSLSAGFAPPDWLPREGRGVLFLDELPQAQPLVMNAVSELVLDRRIGDYRLPPGWVIVAAGNRRTDRAATQEIPSHLKNRFFHIEVEPLFADWKAWAEEPRSSDGRSRINPDLIRFLDLNQGRLNEFNPDLLACPTSRSWAFVSQIMDNFVDKKARRAAISGAVGKHMASELTAFLQDDSDIPTIDAVIADPIQAPMPESPATLSSVLENMANNFPVDKADELAVYMGRAPEENQMVALVQIISRKKEEFEKIRSAPKMKALLQKHGLI
jgi:hypothetical protein